MFQRSSDWGDAFFAEVSWYDPGNLFNNTLYLASDKGMRSFRSFVFATNFPGVQKGDPARLMRNYGKIDYLFFDGCPPPATWDASGTNAEIRKLQPGILISERCGTNEDVASSENHIHCPAKRLRDGTHDLRNWQ